MKRERDGGAADAHEMVDAPDELLALLRSLRQECASVADFNVALGTLKVLLEKPLHHPSEEKYRTIRLGNESFSARLGRFISGIALLRAVGFEDAHAAGQDRGPVTHLALPVADAPALARALILL